MTDAALAANAVVEASLLGRGGTTLSAVLFNRRGSAVGLNIGDSRIYEVEPSGEVSQRSRDDTIEGLLAAAGGSPEPDNRLLQHVGMGRGLLPHVVDLPTRAELILLSSDGAHGIGDTMMKAIVRNAPKASDIVRRLTYFADIRGADDNATVVAVSHAQFEEPDLPDEGIQCTIWTPFRTTEAWFPTSADREKFEPREAPTLDKPVTVVASQGEPKKDKPAVASKPKRSSKKRTKDTAPTLPLDTNPESSAERRAVVIEDIQDGTGNEESAVETPRINDATGANR